MARVQQGSFAAGELTPALHSRTDIAQYRQGLARASNFFVSVYGGILNRAGTQFLDEVEGPSRFIPFALAENLSYALEFSDNLIRFYALGARLIVQPNQTYVAPSIGPNPGQWNNLSTGSATVTAGAQVGDVPQNAGTLLGDLTAGAGVAAAFDGDLSQAAASSANQLSYAGNVGKQWGELLSDSKSIVGIRVYGSSDLGLTGRPQPVTITLQGTDALAAVWRNLGSWRADDRPGFTFERFDGIIPHIHRLHRVVFQGAQSGPVGSGADIIAVAEVEFFERNVSQASIALVGAANSTAYARQTVTAVNSGVEHVLGFFVSGNPVTFQVGAGDDGGIVAPITCNPGWHAVAFTPGVASFNLQFLHGGTDQRNVEGIAFQNFFGSGPAPFFLPQPYRIDDLPKVTFTQDANLLTLCHERTYPFELRRGEGALSWSLTFKRVEPTIEAPQVAAINVSKQGSEAATTTHDYKVTYLTETGEESLPSGALASVQGVATLTTTQFMRITVAQPLPARVIACQLYKLFGGTYGLMGLFVTQFDDTGQAPKVDAPPPQARNPFAGEDNAPVCSAYWEQRQAFGGSNNAPETVELSKTGLPSNFGRSTPPRNDDAITITPTGPQVRKIKHMLGAVDLVLFTEGGVLLARRGESALTPALEGGVRQILARGISQVRPLQIDAAITFVSSDGKSVRLLDPDYAETEVSLLSEHMFSGRKVVDWCYAQSPWSILWLAMDDGRLCTLSLQLQQGISGWAQASTAGQVVSMCAIREFGEDVIYWVVRRWLRGAHRFVIERHRSRKFTDIRDGYFVDCGLSLDNPAPIVALGLGYPATVTLSNAGLLPGDLLELAGTGVGAVNDPKIEQGLPPTPLIDGRQYKVLEVLAGSAYVLGDPDTDEPINWSGLGPWRGEGVVRKCFGSVFGLGHLEGSRVSVLNDGSVEGPYTVVNGGVDLERPGARVHVGLPIVAEAETLDIAEAAEGYARNKSVKEVLVRVRGTRALRIGPLSGPLDYKNPRELEEWDEPTRPGTGLYEQVITPTWGLGGKIILRQDEPLPVEVVAVTPAFDRGGN